MFLCQRQHHVHFGAPGFKVHRIENRAPGIVFERLLHNARFRRIDHQWCFDRLREPPRYFTHLRVFVRALRQRAADVKHVRPRLDLFARDQHDLVVVVFQQQTLHLARPLAVDAFADQEWARLLLKRDRAHRRCGELRTEHAVGRDANRHRVRLEDTPQAR